MANYSMVLTSKQLNDVSKGIELYKNGNMTFCAIMARCYCSLADCNGNYNYNFFSEFMKCKFGLTGITAYKMIIGSFTPSKVFQDKIINLISDCFEEGLIVFQT